MLQHKFETLDGLRGIAAVAVMFFHRRWWFGGDIYLGHAYLAVDFFFMLSGFVLAHAYAKRLAEPGSLVPFLRDRVIRLHPMIAFGAMLALGVTVVEHLKGKPVLYELPALTWLASFVPLPALWTSAEIAFPWNTPLWSLLFELIVSLAFALSLRHLTTRRLVAIVLLCAALLVGSASHESGFQVGFRNQPLNLALGLPRVCVGFFLGVLLRQLWGRLPQRDLKLGWLCALLLLVSFAGVPPASWTAGVYDASLILLLYPLLILAGASSTPRLPRMASLAGAISYPLYVVHEPMLRLVSGMFQMLHLGGPKPGGADALLRCIVVVASAWLVLKLYDEPVRNWLRHRFGSPRHRQPQHAAADPV